MLTFLAVLGAVIAVVVVAAAGTGNGSHAVATGPSASQGPKPPVVLLTFDELPVDSLLGTDGRIDAARYPNFAALAAKSTWYPNATAAHDSTNRAVPAILDGRRPRARAGATEAAHKNSIFTLFGEQGYKVVASEEATSICPRRLCKTRGGVGRIKKLLRNGRTKRFAKWVAAIRTGKPTLYYKHLYLPHGPRLYLPSGRQLTPAPTGALTGLSDTRGYFDRGLTDHNHLRYLLQLGFTDRVLGKLLAKLRREGLFDEALIAVAADHGYAFDVATKDRRFLTSRNIDEIAPVPLFIKTPGQRKGVVDKAYLRTFDILPTMAASLGLSLDWRHEGRPASDPSLRRRRTITILKRFFNGTVTIAAGELEKRRRANIRHAARLFSTGARSKRLFGSPYASLYRIGPNRDLLGRRLAGLRTQGPGPVTIRVSDTRLRQSVSRKKPLPSRIAGTIAGGGGRRNIAVAVNGRVRGVGRSLYVLGGGQELFTVLLPEGALRNGRNDVRVYQVSGRGRGRVLTLLGRA